MFPELITPYNQPIHTAQDIWNSGLTKSADQPCLGHRPLISTNPTKYDNKYHWLTFKQVDERRRALGSTLHQWFASGKLVRTESGYECVGIWSVNRPGTLLSTFAFPVGYRAWHSSTQKVVPCPPNIIHAGFFPDNVTDSDAYVLLPTLCSELGVGDLQNGTSSTLLPMAMAKCPSLSTTP